MYDPELVVYNAGTDILDGDPLGRLKVIFPWTCLFCKKIDSSLNFIWLVIVFNYFFVCVKNKNKCLVQKFIELFLPPFS
jgi:hypothetical protein